MDGVADDLAPPTALAAVQRVWTGVVGEAIAREARPSSERAGVLTVACDASVWAQELELMGPALVERLNAALDQPVVARLRCVATGARRAW